MQFNSIHWKSFFICCATAFFASIPVNWARGEEPPVKPDRPLAEFLENQGYVAISLIPTTDHQGYLVSMILDGKPLLLMLDTGATTICLSKRAGKLFGIDSYPITPSNSDHEHKMYVSTKMGIGSIDRINIPAGKTQYLVERKQTIYAMEGLSSQVTVYNYEKRKNEKVELDGLLGQDFLQDHCAIIDNETSTLFLISIRDRDLPKLCGVWICTKGEIDGKPLLNAAENRIAIKADGAAVLEVLRQNHKGYLGLQGTAGQRIFMFGIQDEKGKPKTLARGTYSIQGDTLKLVLIDEKSKKALDPKLAIAEICPRRFEAKADSGHIYYEFTRKPTEKIK